MSFDSSCWICFGQFQPFYAPQNILQYIHLCLQLTILVHTDWLFSAIVNINEQQ